MFSLLVWCVSISCALFGIFTLDLESRRWAVVGLFFYFLPLIGRFFKNPYLRSYSVWFGLFFVMQSCLSAYGIKKNHHLTPNYSEVIDVESEVLPGIRGLQKITTDALGYRVTKNIDYAKKIGTRIFALGASTTENILIDDKGTWPHLLQAKLEAKSGKPVEVINAGVSGLRMVQIYENFKEALSYHPDFALFLIGVNDWNHAIQTYYAPENIKLELTYRKFGLVAHDMQKLYLKNTLYGKFFTRLKTPRPAPAASSIINTVRLEKGEYYSKQNNTLDKKDVREYFPTELDPEYLVYLNRTANLCKKSKVKCVFITQANVYKENMDPKLRPLLWMTPPNAEYTLTFKSMSHIADLYNQKLKVVGRENGIPVCDLDAALNPSIEIFIDDIHFNLDGSKAVADVLAKCLEGLL